MVRKTLVSVLSAALLLSNTAMAVKPEPQIFKDVARDHANFRAIDYLKANGVVEGYGDGSYRAEASINRAEFLKILMETNAGVEVNAENCFPDVKNEWYAKWVCEAKAKGYVNGYADGMFHPEKEVNFAEAAKMIAMVYDLEITEEQGEWFEKYVTTLENNRAIPATINAFHKYITRGEMAEMVWRVKEKPKNVKSTTLSKIKGKVTAETLVAFDSCSAIEEYLADKGEPGGLGAAYVEDSQGAVPDAPAAESVAVKSSEPRSSDTNVQVKGVGEADIVKNDGKYIYIVSEDRVRVVEAYPAANMKELSAVEFKEKNFKPSEIYVDGNKLIVIGSDYGSVYYDGNPAASMMILPANSTTKIYIFNIANRKNVKLEKSYTFEGSYNSSRKVDEKLYLVMENYNYDWMNPDRPVVPLYRDSTEAKSREIAPCSDILYYPGGQGTNYLIVAGIDTEKLDNELQKQVILGSSGSVYSSRSNLYVAESKYSWWWEPNTEEETIIHKFNLGNDLKYQGKNNVPGTVLNQFSMDEFKGNFRIATTKGNLWEGNSTNNLYILNNELQRVGEIENIAPGERIYSVRFMGERAYMVTFKKVDPFFVIDVKNPSAPKILGKLKIPGYSDYLHPLDENHVIGFGKEAVADENDIEARGMDFAWYQGIKIAMFDVTDVKNPVELHKVQIGDRGTESELLYNHKALLFDEETGLMSFPVTLAEIPEDVKDNSIVPANTYGEYIFQGAYVYDVSVEDGFDFKGAISHYGESEIEEKAGNYWWGSKDIKRIMFIGDYLYTISPQMVKANEIDGLEEVSEVEFEGVTEEDWYWIQ